MNSLCKRKRKREHLLVSYYYLRFFEMPSLTHLFDLAVPVNVKGRKVCHGDLLLQHLQPRLLLLGLVFVLVVFAALGSPPAML